MRQIKLTKGRVAIVDDEDFDHLSQFSWSFTKAGAQTRVRGTREHWLMHRMIMLPPPNLVVDHKNHDKLDNRRENLRIATYQQNGQNSLVSKGRQFKGTQRIRRLKKQWQAKIRHNGRDVFLGTYHTEELAARAYDAAAVTFFGEFACLNFPDANTDETK